MCLKLCAIGNCGRGAAQVCVLRSSDLPAGSLGSCVCTCLKSLVHLSPIISLSLTFSLSLHVFTYRQCLSDCRYIYMDIASLAAKAELHALPAPLVPYLEPTTTTDRTPPNHYLHAGRKGRKVVGMSQASATGATVEPWADQTVSVYIELTVSSQG